MSTQTESSVEYSISHDGAENRIEYDDQEVEELPQTVEFLEILADVEHSQVGHGFRDRYQFDGLVMAEDDDSEEVYELEFTVAEEANSNYNIRATYSEDESQVFFGQIEDVEDIVDELNGEMLERRY